MPVKQLALKIYHFTALCPESTPITPQIRPALLLLSMVLNRLQLGQLQLPDGGLRSLSAFLLYEWSKKAEKLT